MTRVRLFFIGILCIAFCKAATRISVVSGNWTSASTWSGGALPACGDSIVVAPGHTVTTTNNQDFSGCGSRMALVVRGTLYFGNGDKYRFNCNTRLYVYSGGRIVASGGGNSNNIQMCGSTVWEAGDGTYSGPGCMPPSSPACTAVLPVTLLSFEVKPCSGGSCAYWSTCNEKNSDYFELQRSEDGVYFFPCAILKSKAPGGNSHSILHYEANDVMGRADRIWYYRLKQVDADLSFDYSRIVTSDAQAASEAGLFIAPNPSAGDFAITCQGLLNSAAHLQLLNNLGETIYEAMPDLGRTAYSEFRPDIRLLPGIYTCRLLVKNKEKIMRIVIR